MIYTLLITALAVSLDSFVCGLALSIGNHKKTWLVILITLTVFIMCLIANYAGYLLQDVLTEKIASLGGILLVLIGVCNLLKKEENISNNTIDSFFIQSVLVGFAVGLDGAIGTFSLSLMGINSFYVPLTIALTHGIMIALSVALSQTSFFEKISRFKFIPPILLILLGIYKTLGFFM